AERVPARDEGHRLLVIHRHAGEGFPDVPGRGKRIRFAVGPLRIHVDESHLNSAEGIVQLTVAAIALVSQPGALRPPVNVFLRLPDVFAPTAETKGLESHRIQRDVAGEDHQVGPGYFATI